MQWALLTPDGHEVIEVKHYRVSVDGQQWALVVTAAPAMYWCATKWLEVAANN